MLAQLKLRLIVRLLRNSEFFLLAMVPSGYELKCTASIRTPREGGQLQSFTEMVLEEHEDIKEFLSECMLAYLDKFRVDRKTFVEELYKREKL